MATKKPSKKAPVESPQLLHSISALLHTMHCIAQHEDQLCTLLHAARNGDAAHPDLHGELRDLLETMPAHEYTDDLDALRRDLLPPHPKPPS